MDLSEKVFGQSRWTYEKKMYLEKKSVNDAYLS